MNSSLSGKTILVTGASMGIGEWIARHLAKLGAKLILTARSEDKLQSLCQELQKFTPNCVYFAADLSNPIEVQALGEKILKTGSLDGIVHNAGIGLYGDFESLSETSIRELFETNFFSILTLTRLLLPLLKKSSHPRIMMISTVISWRAIPRLSPYCASKAALNLFTEALRLELKKYSITVTNGYPGRTATDFSKNAKSSGWRPFSTNHGGTPPEKVAKKLVRAFVKGQRDEYVSFSNRCLIWLNFFFPKIIDWGLAKFFRKSENG